MISKNCALKRRPEPFSITSSTSGLRRSSSSEESDSPVWMMILPPNPRARSRLARSKPSLGIGGSPPRRRASKCSGHLPRQPPMHEWRPGWGERRGASGHGGGSVRLRSITATEAAACGGGSSRARASGCRTPMMTSSIANCSSCVTPSVKTACVPKSLSCAAITTCTSSSSSTTTQYGRLRAAVSPSAAASRPSARWGRSGELPPPSPPPPSPPQAAFCAPRRAGIRSRKTVCMRPSSPRLASSPTSPSAACAAARAAGSPIPSEWRAARSPFEPCSKARSAA
mmetsp:Transcript_33779/g.111732  ORF Transcript_33779/g.111732 Transcript_33779/m.111732 type:complete len:284 (+) Transcript_33779:320-1171(+)